MSRRLCLLGSIVFNLLLRCVVAEYHVRPGLAPRDNGTSSIPLHITNQCGSTLWPGIWTTGGTGPSTTGFSLEDGAQRSLLVSENWQGRVWGRTNCSFNAQGNALNSSGQTCETGECGGLECTIAGEVPATLAEFTLGTNQDLSFYDISLVDGYNLPLAIVMLTNNNSELEQLSPATTNPSCVASVGDVAPSNFNPYAGGQQFLGTSSNDPLPFETQFSASSIAKWCPWDLQVFPPEAPGDGVYPYPDGNVQRPAFDPCFSACAKYDTPQYCCTGSYNRNCGPNYYSEVAKSVCPDAYSYADDDQSSTFAVPAGAGFEVIFCPGGRSTNILASKGSAAVKHGAAPSSSRSASGQLKLVSAAVMAGELWFAVFGPGLLFFM